MTRPFLVLMSLAAASAAAQTPAEPDWPRTEQEAMEGSKRPLLIMGHTDVVNVDPSKWMFPPFSATRDSGYVYPDSAVSRPADDYFAAHEPFRASMLRTSVSATLIQGGYRVNVIPSEARATLDVRMTPSQDPQAFLEALRKVVDDPTVEVRYAERDARPKGASRLDTEAFRTIEAAIRTHYDTNTLPTMFPGASDMANLRAKGIQCYGIGPAGDVEDGPKGFGVHSDQERILEAEFFRYLHFHYDVVARRAQAASEGQGPAGPAGSR